MTKLLDEAINKIRALPETEQEALAALILKEFDGQKQNTAFSRIRNRPTGMARGNSRPEPPEILKHKDWKATPENAEQISKYIKKLIEDSHVLEARGIVGMIPPGISEKLDYWKKVLAEPMARVAGPGSGGDMRKDILWYEKNAESYKGKWVALRNGILLGNNESRAELRQTLKKSGKLSGSFFIRIGD